MITGVAGSPLWAQRAVLVPQAPLTAPPHWHLGKSTRCGASVCTPRTGGIAWLGVRAWGGSGVQKGRHAGLCTRHTEAGLEHSRQPGYGGGFPREQIHLAPGHGNYC